MSTIILTSAVCPKCNHSATGVSPGARCPTNHGYVLVDSAIQAKWPNDPMLGRILAGRYPILDILGSGGMGAVYLAIQEPVGREVALKVMHPTAAANADVNGRFIREARSIAKLTHDNVVALYDYGEAEDGILYLVMERLNGQTLRMHLQDKGRLSPADTMNIIVPVLAALSEAHALGLVHRDLKPDNVMLVPIRGGGNRAKILDFGTAKVLGASFDSVETRRGLVIGTPVYMSPEQGHGQEVGPASDLYSAGILIYEMLTGSPPFVNSSPFAVIAAHKSTAPPKMDPSLGISPSLEQAVLHALEKDPRNRFASAGAMAVALQGAMAAASGGGLEATLPVIEVPAEAMAAALTPKRLASVAPPAPVPAGPASDSMSLEVPTAAWAKQPLLKLGIIAAVVAGLAALYFWRTSSPPPGPMSASAIALPSAAGEATSRSVPVSGAPATVPESAPAIASVASAMPIASL